MISKQAPAQKSQLYSEASNQNFSGTWPPEVIHKGCRAHLHQWPNLNKAVFDKVINSSATLYYLLLYDLNLLEEHKPDPLLRE